MTEIKNNQGMPVRLRYLLAAVLVCSALLLGFIVPVNAEPLYSDVIGVGCNDLADGAVIHKPSVVRFDFGEAILLPTVITSTQVISKPIDVAITADGRLAIVSGPVGIYMFDVTRITPSSPVFTSTGTGAAQIAVAPDGTKAVVGNSASNVVKVFSLSDSGVESTSVKSIDLKRPVVGTRNVYAVGITTDSRHLVVGANDGYAHVLNLSTLEEERSIDLGAGFSPAGMAVDPSGKTIVITSFSSVDVAVLGVDLEKGEFSFRGYVSVGTGSGTEPAITREGHYAFVANSGANTVSVIDLSASMPAVVGNPITVGSNPQSVSIVDDYNAALVTNRGSSSISVIDIASLTVDTSKTIVLSPATTSIHRFAVWRPNRAPTAIASGPDQSVAPGATVTLDGSMSYDSDRDHFLRYMWTITAPDGTTAPLSGATPTFSASQTGTYAVELIVTDPLGLTSADEISVTVTPSNTPPTLDPIGSKSVDEGQLLTFSITASDTETPAGLTFSAEPLPPWAAFDGTTFSGKPIDGDAGEYTVKFTVTDASGESDDETVTITVNDVVFDKTAPEIMVFTADPNPVAFNTPVVLSATIDDSVTGGSIIEWASCSIDGGAPLSMTAKDGAFDGSTESVLRMLTGLTTGVHRVTLQAADAEGNVATISEPLLIIVYDPSAGFVTGGGWINSPVDTASPYQAVTGKATFGFVAKYQKGMTAPKGETEFTFKTGGLTFHSDSYNWLLVTQSPEGLPKAELQGTGTLNGVGGYVMTLAAVDNGRADTLRFQIADSMKKVVYDTGDAMIPLEGGSIVIHSK